jgi:putative PIN family toxin of toxin-antitoxin system
VKVFLDTNVIVSALTARGLSADVFRLILTEHDLLTGEANLKEIRRVLRNRMRLPTRQVDDIERLLREHKVIPVPDKPLDLELRDPDDRWVLASTVAGSAGVLVTGDQDLLSVSDQAPVPILNPRAFWELARRPR